MCARFHAVVEFGAPVAGWVPPLQAITGQSRQRRRLAARAVDEEECGRNPPGLPSEGLDLISVGEGATIEDDHTVRTPLQEERGDLQHHVDAQIILLAAVLYRTFGKDRGADGVLVE